MTSNIKEKDNKKVRSIAIDPQLDKELVNYAHKKGITLSSYVSMVLIKALKVPFDEEPIIIGKPMDEEFLPVMLKIPSHLKGNREALKLWMDAQIIGIVNKVGGLS